MLTTEQLEARRIGGSEAAIACGFEHFGKGPARLWAEKTGRAKRDELPADSVERARIGELMEDVIAQLYTERTGVRLRKTSKTYQKHDFMTAHLDRLVEGDPDRIVEIKNVAAEPYRFDEWGEPGTDQVPFGYLMQCHHYLVVRDAKLCTVVALVGGNRLVTYEIRFDPTMAEMIVDYERDFWQHVVDETPPPPVNARDTAALYPKDRGEPKFLEADRLDIRQAWQQGRMAGAMSSRYKREADNAKEVIKRYMGDAAMLRDTNGRLLATWENNKPQRETAWEALAEELWHEVDGDQDAWNLRVQRHTSTKPGSRPLLLKPGKHRHE